MRKIRTPILEVSNVTKKTKKASLDGVSLSLAAGDSLAVLCKNMAACDLLLEILSGSVKPEKGKVFFKGDDVTREKNSFGTVPRVSSVPKRKTITDISSAPVIKRGLSRAVTAVLVKKELPSMGLEEYGEEAFSSLPDNICARGELFAAYMCSHELIVMCEPFASLSEEERLSEIDRLLKLKNGSKLSLLVFTENIDTALALGDNVMVTDEMLKSKGIIAVGNNQPKAKERLLAL